MINVRNFVDVNILSKTSNIGVSTRDTVILFTDEAVNAVSASDNTFASLDAFKKEYTDDNHAKCIAYLTTYFNNGGLKVKLIHVDSAITATDLLATIEALPNNFIVYASTLSSNVMKDAAKDATWTGIDRKILVDRITTVESYQETDNLALKYSTDEGAEMTIAAYLSNIDINKMNVVQDYCFTKETVKTIITDNAKLELCQTNNINVDVELASSTRNIGGNLTNGQDLVNEYMLIVLQQTVTDAVLAAILRKLSGSAGLAAIKAAITEDLFRYVSNGYLATDKVWTNPDYVVNVKGKNYTIVEQNTPITKGFIVKILPLSSLTTDEKQAHLTPKIFIILADAYGFRNVVIDGEVY